MGYIRHTRLGTRAHTEGPTVHAARAPPLVFSPPPQVRSLRQLDELMRQLVKVVPRAESSALPVPQPATLAAWGCAWSALGCATHSGRALKPPRAQDPGVEGCGAAARDPAEAGRFHGVPRARRRMYWVTRRSRNTSRRAQPPYTAASRLQTRCTCETNAKAWSSVTVVQKSGTYILTFITPYSKRITPLVRSKVHLAGLRQRKAQPR